MKKIVQFFLLYLMIAVPIQGITATALFDCDTQHHEAMTADTGNAHHSSESISQADQDECSSCVACCIGCAITIEPIGFTAPLLSSEKINLRFFSYTGHINDDLERPPRA